MSDDAPLYEMLWDCRYCDTPRLLGLTHRHCPRCGAPQNPEARYFPAEHEKVPARDHVYYGADVRCGACHEANSRKAEHCRGCGAPLSGAAEVARKADEPAEKPAAQVRALASEPKAAKARPQDVKRAKKAGCGWVGLGCLGVLVTLVAGVLVAVFWTEQGELTVTGHAWQRTISIERFGPKEASSWCDKLPSDARLVRRTREERSQRKLRDGESCHTRREDLGDGTFREHEECTPRYREEPVYDDRCHYTVLRWSEARVAESTGTSLARYPAWPNVGVLRTGRCEGCEREGPRRQSYTLVLRDGEGEEHRCELGQDAWARTAVGASFRGKLSVLTGKLDCKSLGIR